MPVILPPERIDEWLHVPAREPEQESYAKTLRALLAPAAGDVLVATEVSQRVNSVKNDDPACLAVANDREIVEAPRFFSGWCYMRIALVEHFSVNASMRLSTVM